MESPKYMQYMYESPVFLFTHNNTTSTMHRKFKARKGPPVARLVVNCCYIIGSVMLPTLKLG